MYKDYALIKLNFGERVLAYAPAWELEEGDEVIINGERGNVLAVTNHTEVNDDLKMVLMALQQDEPLKIDCKVIYKKYAEAEK